MRTLLDLHATISAVITHHDAPNEEIWWNSCATLAQSCHIPVLAPDDPNDATVLAHLQSIRPPIIYSFAYRKLVPDPILRIASIGAFNLHPSLLPAYRGRAPVNWVLVNGERETGVTLHHMVARADAGDIVGQRRVEIDDSDTALTLYRKLVPLAAALIREFHPLIVEGHAPRYPQDLSKGSYFGRRSPDDGRLAWTWPARRIFNLVRAVTHPYPGAFCFTSGKKLFIWEAGIGRESGQYGRPGAIVGAARGGIEIAAGEGTVVVLRAQLDRHPEAAAGDVFSSSIPGSAGLD